MKPTEPNFTKQEMYSATMRRLNKAIELSFSYEAIMLEYAMIEDRLSKMLFLLGIVSKGEQGLSVTKKARRPLRELLGLSETAKFGVNNINAKLDILEKLAECDCSESPHFMFAAAVLRNEIGADELTEAAEAVRRWKNIRNTVVRGLMNRVPDEADSAVTELALSGKQLFRTLDKYVRCIEKCNIRDKFKIQ